MVSTVRDNQNWLPPPLTKSRGYDDGCVGYMADDGMSVRKCSLYQAKRLQH